MVGARQQALVLVFATLTACTGPNAEGYLGTTKRHGKDSTTFYVNNGGEPEYLDPGMANDTVSAVLIEDLFEVCWLPNWSGPESFRECQHGTDRQ